QALRTAQRPEGARRRIPLAPRRLADAGRRDGQGLARADRAGGARELSRGGPWRAGAGWGTARDAVKFSRSTTHVRIQMSPETGKPCLRDRDRDRDRDRGRGLAGAGHCLGWGRGLASPWGGCSEQRVIDASEGAWSAPAVGRCFRTSCSPVGPTSRPPESGGAEQSELAAVT